MVVDLTKLVDRELEAVQQAVPAHMMFLMMEQCQGAGLELRADVLHHLNNAAAAPLAKLDALSISRAAQRIDDVARLLLHELSPDDPRHGLYCCTQFVLTLVDEGRFSDAKNQAVLVALLLMDDVKDDRPDTDGALPVWREEQIKWEQEAKKMLRRANLLGYFLTPLCN